jgi:hypothetical protein
MFRLLGFIIGSAVSILTILLIIGMPEFHLSNPDIDKRRFDEAVLMLKEKSLDAQQVAEEMADKLAQAVPETDASPPPPLMQAAIESEPLVEDGPMSPAPDAFGEIVPMTAADPQWHAFWNPFRSKIAAQGFVSRLEKVTGLDYRIEKIDIGIYEVSFAYASDDERSVKLSQISSATGLELPET